MHSHVHIIRVKPAATYLCTVAVSFTLDTVATIHTKNRHSDSRSAQTLLALQQEKEPQQGGRYTYILALPTLERHAFSVHRRFSSRSHTTRIELPFIHWGLDTRGGFFCSVGMYINLVCSFQHRFKHLTKFSLGPGGDGR